MGASNTEVILFSQACILADPLGMACLDLGKDLPSFPGIRLWETSLSRICFVTYSSQCLIALQ